MGNRSVRFTRGLFFKTYFIILSSNLFFSTFAFSTDKPKHSVNCEADSAATKNFNSPELLKQTESIKSSLLTMILSNEAALLALSASLESWYYDLYRDALQGQQSTVEKKKRLAELKSLRSLYSHLKISASSVAHSDMWDRLHRSQQSEARSLGNKTQTTLASQPIDHIAQTFNVLISLIKSSDNEINERKLKLAQKTMKHVFIDTPSILQSTFGAFDIFGVSTEWKSAFAAQIQQLEILQGSGESTSPSALLDGDAKVPEFSSLLDALNYAGDGGEVLRNFSTKELRGI